MQFFWQGSGFSSPSPQQGPDGLCSGNLPSSSFHPENMELWSQLYLQAHLQELTRLLVNHNIHRAFLTWINLSCPPGWNCCFISTPIPWTIHELCRNSWQSGEVAVDPCVLSPQGWCVHTHKFSCINVLMCFNDSQIDLFPISPTPDFSFSPPNLLGNREEQTSGALGEGWNLHRLCTLCHSQYQHL